MKVLIWVWDGFLESRSQTIDLIPGKAQTLTFELPESHETVQVVLEPE